MGRRNRWSIAYRGRGKRDLLVNNTMTAKTIEDILPTREELLEQGFAPEEDEEELERREDKAERDAEGLSESNIVAD